MNLSIGDEAKLLHLRLGHFPFNKMSHIDSKFSNKASNDNICQNFPKARQVRKSFPKDSVKSVNCFDLLHVDTWEPYKIRTHDACSYFLTVIDDMSRHTWTFLMKQKSDCVDILEFLITFIHTQFGIYVKSLRTDNVKELCEGRILTVYEKFGIFH